VAVTAARSRGDFAGFLPRNMAAPIFERAARTSAIMQLSPQVPLGAEGETIPVVTGRLQAGWVSEAGLKPASQASLGLVNMDPKKIAVIAIVSAEVVRANPGNYMSILRNQVGEAFASAFDLAAMHDMGPDLAAGAGPFATYLDQATATVELGTTTQANGGLYGDLVAGLSTLTAAGKRLTGFALDGRIEPMLLGGVDTTGRPLWVDLPGDEFAPGLARRGRLLARPSTMTDANIIYEASLDVMGYGGDWSQTAWGTVGGITYDVSTETAVTINGVLVSLWERNLMAIRAEAEYGFFVNDPASFVKYLNAV
jgi:HK97 family phage major capsid protein